VLTLRYKVKIEESPEKILPSAIQTETDTEHSVSTEKAQPLRDKNSIIHSLDTVIKELSDLDGFNTIIEGLENKQSRLKNSYLTIDLIGTFRASKSSFCNVLFSTKV